MNTGLQCTINAQVNNAKKMPSPSSFQMRLLNSIPTKRSTSGEEPKSSKIIARVKNKIGNEIKRMTRSEGKKKNKRKKSYGQADIRGKLQHASWRLARCRKYLPFQNWSVVRWTISVQPVPLARPAP